ncbi:hypothetical protein KGR20_10805 [Cytobacillus oceanisediminis]|uniref:Uncharacterized protein n=2 Tax=Niallia TaxID=2837506 RepID=A0A941JQR7_NIACI|nr:MULTISPECIES: hypothetical protein [Bacillaceae]EOR24740.1 hypothetical protein A499_07215 [Niallia nealsonii AAU1]MBQ6447235.1 hypothetical protein [Bacillus sp. (in: firmicutes)]MDU1844766.1 hypothetical protein [Niallia nealsonii]MBZ9534745.1 hypothetical protein [Cytobacillus oceanisediminis]MCB5237435.1 hypothetical protein [Niallia circulans]
MSITRLADRFWDGMTLTYVNHKGIIYPYFAFMITAFLFELFLTVLIGISIYFFYQSGYYPNVLFYIGCCVVFLLLIMTMVTIKSIYLKIKYASNSH